MSASIKKCFVSNCNNSNTIKVPFPTNPELRIKWLNSLEMPDFEPTEDSFVCLTHFVEEDNQHVKDEGTQEILEEMSISTQSPQKENEESEKVTPEVKSNDLENLQTQACRLCTGHNEVSTDVFDLLEDDITIAVAITRCIPLIKITKQDHLPKLICNYCLNMIRVFHKFRDNCLKMDFKQRDQSKASKRKSQEVERTPKKICVKPEPPEGQIKKEFSSESELLRVLEGKLGKEGVDNIIFEVRSDDESEEPQTSQVVDVDKIKLPQGIKVVVSPAKVGVSSAQTLKGLNNSEFCVIDDYLFEYRLSKGKIRYLSCVANKCRSTAEQDNSDASTATVRVAHNHPPPPAEERKKQIFFHSMRRKMQSDKSLNFRSVYEEFCRKDPELKKLVPLKTVINQICCQQMSMRTPPVQNFEHLYELIENDDFQKLHFTHSNKQFYQEKFEASNGSKAIVFANVDTIEGITDSKLMYVDASFRIETKEEFKYHLVSVLVWVSDSYYPILFALVNEKSQEIYKAIFTYLRDFLAPRLRPEEIVTDYEAALYYSLGETYLDSHIGGSVFYYTQNLYKKICSLNLSRELETNSCFRSIYHMILMLPLLPVNTILDGLSNIESQANEMGQAELAAPIFDYVRSQWVTKVTPDLFCVHRLENRINENVIAPFKKLRDFLMLTKGHKNKQNITVVSVVEKLIELEGYLEVVYSSPASKKSFARDLTTSQKRNVIRAWQFIESHPKININNFFTKVLGYIKCMENQLWIWGFYRYRGEADDELINAANFSIVSTNDEDEDDHNYNQSAEYVDYVYPEENVVMDVVIDQKGGFVVSEGSDVKKVVAVKKNDQFHNAVVHLNEEL